MTNEEREGGNGKKTRTSGRRERHQALTRRGVGWSMLAPIGPAGYRSVTHQS